MAGIAVLMVLVGAIYFTLSPSSGLYPRCLFKAATGWDCPGCGSQRAIHALLHGDIAEAWRMNAFMVASLPLVVLLAIGEIWRKRWPRFYGRVNSPTIIYSVAIAIVAWWIGRNVWL
ncbi:MAG: DUF2752 domain-containing protein [Bacteroidales bacterium]|nr:DUF2752 domain-containing protein [Bacteroidales bacterium]